jgi:hypothetical protein
MVSFFDGCKDARVCCTLIRPSTCFVHKHRASVLYKSGLKETEYVGGAAVRKLIVGSEQRMVDMQILTTNESPPESPIPFHHELAQTPNPPTHICFFCHDIQDPYAGATPLIRSDSIVEYLQQTSPGFLSKLESLGVKYIKVAPEVDDPTSALGRSPSHDPKTFTPTPPPPSLCPRKLKP